MIIGRPDPGSDDRPGAPQKITLEDPQKFISRTHAAIEWRGGCWWIFDCNSHHGTALDDQPLTSAGRVLADSGRIRICDRVYEVRLDDGRECDRRQGVLEPSTMLSTFVPAESSRVSTIDLAEVESLAQHRLTLLIDLSSRFHGLFRIEELRRAVLMAALEGTKFARAAWLRPVPDASRVELIASESSPGAHSRDETWRITRTLVERAMEGRIALLEDLPGTESIVALKIRQAICVPVQVEQSGAIEAVLYLDAREFDPPVADDAAAYAQAVSRLAGLALANQRRQELMRDVIVARETQVRLMPAANGRRACARWTWRHQPGRIVGGDLFDVQAIDDETASICFGDVAGEGIGAGILMATTITLLRNAFSRTRDVAEALAGVNRHVFDHTEPGKYVTLWAGVLDRREHKLHFADAGHHHWLYLPQGGRAIHAGADTDIVVGIDSDAVFRARSIDFSPGDRVLIFSDGLVEQPVAGAAPIGRVKRFGEERVMTALGGSTSTESDVDALFRAVAAFAGRDGLAFDTTVASVEMLPDC